MFHQRTDRGEISLLWLVVYRLIEVKELADYRAITDVFGYGTESVILGNAADVVLAIILAERFIVPRDTFLYIEMKKMSAAKI